MKERKPPYLFYGICYVVALFLSLQVVSVSKPGDTIFEIMGKYQAMVKNCWYEIHWNHDYSMKTIFVVTALMFLFVLVDSNGRKQIMPGIEHGSAKWGNIKKFNEKYADEEKSWNRIFSKRIRVSVVEVAKDINNNVLVIGGSGSGKTLRFVTPNIYQARADSLYPGTMVFSDPKGELLKRNGRYLKAMGYKIRVLDLTAYGMAQSDGYNPFEYIKNERDINRLILNLVANTTEKNAAKNDPFWEKSEIMFLQALCLFIWLDGPDYGYPRNFNSVIDLLTLADVPSETDRSKSRKSKLDSLFDQLAEDTKGRERGGIHHPAYVKYKKAFVGAADTVRSIIISANVRLAIFENPDVHRLMEKDEMDLRSFGTGKVDGQENVKTALFCVVPDSDTTYNCIAGLLYMQLYQELYDIADNPYSQGYLPVPVTFWLDEFANTALPANFLKMLATMRSRHISVVIIIQALSQIKTMYKDEWESVTANCDTMIYLGSNEESTHEYVSKKLGKATIWKKSMGRSYGKNGSSSKNEDMIGREVMTPDEVGIIDNKKCIVFVKGERPLFDDKYPTFGSEGYRISKKLGNYVHALEKGKDEVLIPITKEEYEQLKKKGKTAEINLSDEDMKQALYGRSLSDEKLLKLMREQGTRTDVAPPEDQEEVVIDITDLSLEQVLFIPEFDLTDEVLNEVLTGIENGLSQEEIKSYMLLSDVNEMRTKRRLLEAVRKREERKVDNG